MLTNRTTPIRRADRLDRLPPYVFVTISQNVQRLTAAGHDIVRFDIGNPDMPPPQHVIDTLSKVASQPDQHGYAGYRGIAAFRQAVAGHYQRRFGVTLDPETEVLPLIGSKEGIVNLMLAYVDGDTVVLVPEIGYPAYEMGARLAGGTVRYVPMPPDNGYLLDVTQINPEDIQQAQMLWVNYPNNPTGAIANLAFYEQLVAFCGENGILLASDNPYAEVLYDDTTGLSALQADPDKTCTVEFMSFSKSYNMAGWRLGAAVGNADVLKNLLHVKSNMDSGHFKAIYHAGIAALEQTDPAWIAERNAIYQQRRDLIMNALPDVGLKAEKPAGAMYVWAQVMDGNAEQYVMDALKVAHVSLAPGIAYGPGGAGYIRLSVGVPNERLQAGFDRLKTWYMKR